MYDFLKAHIIDKIHYYFFVIWSLNEKELKSKWKWIEV